MKFRGACLSRQFIASLPVRGAWIEMRNHSCFAFSVASSLPVRGAWIEMKKGLYLYTTILCRSPCGERGLKYTIGIPLWLFSIVAPRAGSVD